MACKSTFSQTCFSESLMAGCIPYWYTIGWISYSWIVLWGHSISFCFILLISPVIVEQVWNLTFTQTLKEASVQTSCDQLPPCQGQKPILLDYTSNKAARRLSERSASRERTHTMRAEWEGEAGQLRDLKMWMNSFRSGLQQVVWLTAKGQRRWA